MGKIVKILIVLGVLGVAGYETRDSLKNIFVRIESVYFPCAQPITYRIGTFNARFGIGEEDFLKAIDEAARVWEDPAQKNLFAYDPKGNLKMNLVYDYRQEATDTLQRLGFAVNDTKASYDALKTKYDALSTQYNQSKSAFDARVAVFQSRKNKYELQVADWNSRGGAPKDIYEGLQNEKGQLNAEFLEIQQLQTGLNGEAQNINALVIVLNRVANSLNLDVSQFNEVGKKNSGEFEEGLYQSSPDGQKIDVYEFENSQKLVRVLAHELGHALGIQHLENPEAIMYKLNQSANEKLTPDDLSALKKQCHIK